LSAPITFHDTSDEGQNYFRTHKAVDLGQNGVIDNAPLDVLIKNLREAIPYDLNNLAP